MIGVALLDSESQLNLHDLLKLKLKSVKGINLKNVDVRRKQTTVLQQADNEYLHFLSKKNVQVTN